MSKFLFVCGAPRSGTTAMWRFLSSDKKIILGVERYGNLFFKKPITTDLFEKDRFYTYFEGDTFYKDLDKFSEYYTSSKADFDGATYYGDKIPLLYNYIDRLLANIPEAKIVIMLRNIIDVASSYEARANNKDDLSWSSEKRTESAINDWRDSLKIIQKYLDDERIIPIIYEDFFSDEKHARDLYKKIGLDFNENALESFNALSKRNSQLEGERARTLDLNAVRAITETAPFGLYRELLNKIRQESHV